MSKHRANDHSAEKVVASYLDKHFYSTLYPKFQRIHDKPRQIKGYDVIISIDDDFKVVDEKSATNYVRTRLHEPSLTTFAFELSFLRRGSIPTQGWLFDDNKETTDYLLSWIWANKNRGFKEDDIFKVECMMINRQKLLDHLMLYGLDKITASILSKDLRRTESIGSNYHPRWNVGGFKVHYSKFSTFGFLPERPINVVIKKHVLSALSELHLFV